MNAPALIWIADHSFIMTEKTKKAPKLKIRDKLPRSQLITMKLFSHLAKTTVI